jgi:hypothetical protein
MKELLISLVVFFGPILSVQASEDSSPTPWITFRSVVSNKYILPSGSGFTVYNKPVIQTDILANFENGVHADLLNTTPFEGYDQDNGTEQDLTIGWARTFNRASDVNLDLGIAYLDEPKLKKLGAQDALYGYVKLSKASDEFTLSGMYENYTSMPGSAYPGGNIFSINLNGVLPMFKDKASLNISFAELYDTGSFGFNQGFYLRGGLEFDWKLTKHLWMILPQGNCCIPVKTSDSPLNWVALGGFSLQM